MANIFVSFLSQDLLVLKFEFQIKHQYKKSDFKFNCQRVDDGEGPLISYDSTTFSADIFNNRIILNDGSAIGWGDEGIDIETSYRNETLLIRGLVSADISLADKTFGATQEVVFKFDIRKYGSYLERWFKENTDFLDNKKTTFSTVEDLFICRTYFY